MIMLKYLFTRHSLSFQSNPFNRFYSLLLSSTKHTFYQIITIIIILVFWNILQKFCFYCYTNAFIVILNVNMWITFYIMHRNYCETLHNKIFSIKTYRRYPLTDPVFQSTHKHSENVKVRFTNNTKHFSALFVNFSQHKPAKLYFEKQ